MKFCDKVKKERREKGLTQQQFADMLGVSLRTITNYEKGESAYAGGNRTFRRRRA